MSTTSAANAGTCAGLDVTLDFLRRHPPFDRMRDDVLRAMTTKLALAHFAKDAIILSAQNGPVAQLHIIERGVVGRRPNDTTVKKKLEPVRARR